MTLADRDPPAVAPGGIAPSPSPLRNPLCRPWGIGRKTETLCQKILSRRIWFMMRRVNWEQFWYRDHILWTRMKLHIQTDPEKPRTPFSINSIPQSLVCISTLQDAAEMGRRNLTSPQWFKNPGNGHSNLPLSTHPFFWYFIQHGTCDLRLGTWLLDLKEVR